MYTYAFVPETAASLMLPAGISGDLMLVCEGGVGAVVEPELDVEALQQSDERLMRAVLHHDQVIREVFEQSPLLPLRFGTRFVSKDKLLDHLRSHAADYQTALAGLAQQAEFTLKLSPRSPDEPVASTDSLATTGKAYFLAKKQQFQRQLERQQRQRDELLALKEAIAQAYPHLYCDEPRDGVERLHLLVGREAESVLRKDLEEWRSRCPSWELALSEPLPPYHFV